MVVVDTEASTATAKYAFMRKIFSDSALTPHSLGFSALKIALVEPALVVSAVFFWVAALPFVALSVRCVKIWETLMALKAAAGTRPNPLILRHGLAKSALTRRSSARSAQD
jgi:hypothetical protein